MDILWIGAREKCPYTCKGGRGNPCPERHPVPKKTLIHRCVATNPQVRAERARAVEYCPQRSPQLLHRTRRGVHISSTGVVERAIAQPGYAPYSVNVPQHRCGFIRSPIRRPGNRHSAHVKGRLAFALDVDIGGLSGRVHLHPFTDRCAAAGPRTQGACSRDPGFSEGTQKSCLLQPRRCPAARRRAAEPRHREGDQGSRRTRMRTVLIRPLLGRSGAADPRPSPCDGGGLPLLPRDGRPVRAGQ